MKYKYFDHTADAMFESYGKTLEEAFENAALAMFNILTDIDKVKPKEKIKFQIKTDTKEKLLFDFLDELLFYMDTEGLILSKFNVQINNHNLKCIAKGDKAINYETHGDIKAPTYNEMDISKTKKGYKIRAVVDI